MYCTVCMYVLFRAVSTEPSCHTARGGMYVCTVLYVCTIHTVRIHGTVKTSGKGALQHRNHTPLLIEGPLPTLSARQDQPIRAHQSPYRQPLMGAPGAGTLDSAVSGWQPLSLVSCVEKLSEGRMDEQLAAWNGMARPSLLRLRLLLLHSLCSAALSCTGIEIGHQYNVRYSKEPSLLHEAGAEDGLFGARLPKLCCYSTAPARPALSPSGVGLCIPQRG